MDINSLEYFLQLAKYEHMSQTAEFFNIAQSSLSRTIVALEKELGVQLFDRVGKSIRLNQNGKDFYEYVEQSLMALQYGIAKINSKRYEIRGHISIATLAHIDVIMQCIIEYSRLNPNVTFELKTKEEMQHDGLGNDVDLILFADYGNYRNLTQNSTIWVSQKLLTDGLYIMASPEHLNIPKDQDTIDISMLKEAMFVESPPSNNLFISQPIFRICQSAGFSPRILCETSNLFIKARFAAAGLSVSSVPECCIKDVQRYVPSLRFFKIKQYDQRRDITLMRKKQTLTAEHVIDFCNFVFDYYGLDYIDN